LFTKYLAALLLVVSLPLAAQETGDESMSEVQPELARCINLGNMLEAPAEGEWGLRVQEPWLQIIADAGFDTVRIPIRWSAHAAAEPPYTIDEAFFARVDEVVGWALDAGLQAIINIHHYEEIHADPEAHRARLVALWEQISTHYQTYPNTLLFEVMNEPTDRFTPRLWNEYQLEIVEVIRATNPTRTIVIGGVDWNSLWQLPWIRLPQDKTNLIVTFHNYEPFEFTHQGAEWTSGTDAYLGREWPIRDDEVRLRQYFDYAAQWQKNLGVPLLMGEFGAYYKADMDSRIRFTRAVVERAEAEGIAWCYWEFAAGFGIYDRVTGRFNDLYRALIPEEA
jgi:endoglucanase